MKKVFLRLVGSIAIALGAAGCTKFQSSKTVTAPSTVATPVPGGASNGTLVGTWGEPQALTIPSPASCANFQWQITSQSPTAISGSFSATCDGGIGLSAGGSGNLTSPTTIDLTVTGVALVAGAPVCNFSLNGTGVLSDNDNTLTIPYSGTLRRHVDAPPAPPPAPDPVPPAPIIGGPTDAIDLNQAIILNSPRDFASWPITTKITALSMGPNGVHVEFTKQDGPGRWPDVVPPGWGGPLQYTLGMALNINGQWYLSTVVEYWYGLPEAGGPPSQFASNWFYDPARWAPMTYHQPQPGETIGFVVCEGDCRNNPDGSVSPLRERSQLVLVPMPPNDSGNAQTFRLRR